MSKPERISAKTKLTKSKIIIAHNELLDETAALRAERDAAINARVKVEPCPKQTRELEAKTVALRQTTQDVIRLEGKNQGLESDILELNGIIKAGPPAIYYFATGAATLIALLFGLSFSL